MKQPDLQRVIDQGDESAVAAREAAVDLLAEGDTSAKSTKVAALAEHLAYVAVSYARTVGETLDDTGLIVVPPMPPNIPPEQLIEEFPWPTGYVLGELRDANERRAAVRALVAHLIMTRDLARNGFSAARTVVDSHKAQMSWVQSKLKAERDEQEIDRMAGPAQHTPRRGSSRPRNSWEPPPHSDDDYVH